MNEYYINGFKDDHVCICVYFVEAGMYCLLYVNTVLRLMIEYLYV